VPLRIKLNLHLYVMEKIFCHVYVYLLKMSVFCVPRLTCRLLLMSVLFHSSRAIICQRITSINVFCSCPLVKRQVITPATLQNHTTSHKDKENNITSQQSLIRVGSFHTRKRSTVPIRDRVLDACPSYKQTINELTDVHK
jgi:hypothetical protein